MSRLSKIPVLVFDDDPRVIEDFRIVLDPPLEAGDESDPMGIAFEAELIGSSAARGQFPEVELTVEKNGPMAVEAGRRAVERGQAFRIAFIDIGVPPGHWGLDTAAALRALDPKLYIVLTISEPGPRLVDICEQVAPADRLSLMHKPLRAPEVEQLVLAAEARHVQERSDELARTQARDIAAEALRGRHAQAARLAESLSAFRNGVNALLRENARPRGRTSGAKSGIDGRPFADRLQDLIEQLDMAVVTPAESDV